MRCDTCSNEIFYMEPYLEETSLFKAYFECFYCCRIWCHTCEPTYFLCYQCFQKRCHECFKEDKHFELCEPCFEWKKIQYILNFEND